MRLWQAPTTTDSNHSRSNFNKSPNNSLQFPLMARARKKAKNPRSILLSRQRNLRGDGPVAGSRALSNTSSLSSKVGRTLIRNHHTLQKRLSQALSRNDTETANSIRAEIEAKGGIEKYQQASVRPSSSLSLGFLFNPFVLMRVI